MAYDQPLVETFRWLANGSVSTAAGVGYIHGPDGKQGRVLNFSAITTTATTVAASKLLLGTDADADAICTLDVPVLAVKKPAVMSAGDIMDAPLLDADTVYLVSGDGGATAGAVDITLTIGWF